MSQHQYLKMCVNSVKKETQTTLNQLLTWLAWSCAQRQQQPAQAQDSPSQHPHPPQCRREGCCSQQGTRQRQDPSSSLSHPAKTSPTGLISPGFSYLSHRQHLTAAKSPSAELSVTTGTSVQSSTGAQPRSRWLRGTEWLCQLCTPGPPRGFAGNFPDFSGWEGLGRS